MRAVWWIAGKDLRQRLRDRSAILLAVVLPVALAGIFKLVVGSAATPRAFDYAVADLDHGPAATAFTAEVLGGPAVDGVLTVRRVDSRAEAERLAADGSIDAAFVLPADFSAAVRTLAPAAIEVIGNADAPIGASVARALAESYTAELQSVRAAVAAVAAQRPLTPEEAGQAAARARDTAAPVALTDGSAAAKVLDSTTYSAVAMSVFFLFFTVQFGVTSILDERAGGTLRRLLAAPIPRGAILAGKLTVSALLGLASMAVLVVATSVLLGARWGPPLGVAVLLTAGVLAATGITAVVASLAPTADAAGNAQSVVAVVLGLLGGAFFPISEIGGPIATVSLVTPHAWLLRGFGDLAGGGVADIGPAVAALAGFALVAGAVAAIRLGTVIRL
ncbi:ABC transporter permease [Nocardia sp. IFM 10818]